DCCIVEARPRLGGRAWTVGDGSGAAIDLGCGWLHSADRNPWAAIAEAQGRTIDKTPPPWRRRSAPIGFPLAEQSAFLAALQKFEQQLDTLPDDAEDVAAATFLEPLGRWNGLIDAVGTYVSGADLARVSARDLGRYDDSGVNWRGRAGEGTPLAAPPARRPGPPAPPACRSCSTARCEASITANGDCVWTPPTARSRPTRPSSPCRAPSLPRRRLPSPLPCRKKSAPPRVCRSGTPTSCFWRCP